MANKLKPKLLAICQDDWGKRGGVAAWYHFARSLPGGRVLINAQIAAPLEFLSKNALRSVGVG
jgi:hypothetical protein